jgi:hypothetical protein
VRNSEELYLMARYERFTFLCNKNERQSIRDLAEKLRRSQADAIRHVIRNVLYEMDTSDRYKSRPQILDQENNNGGNLPNLKHGRNEKI